MSNEPDDEDDPPQAPQDLFPFDEMSTGETSSLLRRANVITGAPATNLAPPDPALKVMTGAQLAFRPSAPPKKSATGTHAAFKPAPSAPLRPGTGTQPAFKPATGTQPAFKLGPSAPLRTGTGTQAAFKPVSGSHSAVGRSGTGTNTFAAFKPNLETEPQEFEEDGPPVFDPERLQAQIRAMSMTDSALGRSAKALKPSRAPSSAADDTFVKTKMKQAEAKVPDFDLDEDLG